MTVTIDSSPAPAPVPPTTGMSASRKRAIAMSVWGTGFLAWWFLLGLPMTDPILLFAWLWAATIAWRIDRPWREYLNFGRDWFAIVLLLEAYNFSRGFADNGATPHVLEMV